MKTDVKTKKRRGRQPDASSKSGKIRELLATGMSATEIAKKVGCTPALVYNVKARQSGTPAAGAPKRGPGRPKGSKNRVSAAPSTSFAGIDAVLDAVRNSERERARLRAALEKLKAVVDDVLA
ncbi:MAG: helix-turn-helix domain-containing protein [Planctomycetota bacterium]